MKLETSEEAAIKKEKELRYAPVGIIPNFKDGFIEGAKWQAEIMYSEEEVQNLIKIIEWYDDNSDVRPNWDRIIDGLTMFEWFEQFKNK